MAGTSYQFLRFLRTARAYLESWARQHGPHSRIKSGFHIIDSGFAFALFPEYGSDADPPLLHLTVEDIQATVRGIGDEFAKIQGRTADIAVYRVTSNVHHQVAEGAIGKVP